MLSTSKIIFTIGVITSAINAQSMHGIFQEHDQQHPSLVYTAQIPNKFPIHGHVNFLRMSGSPHIQMSLSLETNQAKEGSFAYHIHEKPVPESGDCNATGGHYDPGKVKQKWGDAYNCTWDKLDRCEIGDLSGKHGALSWSPGYAAWRFTADDYQLRQEMLEGKSVVVHDRTGKRIACASLVKSAGSMKGMDGEVVSMVVGGKVMVQSERSKSGERQPIVTDVADVKIPVIDEVLEMKKPKETPKTEGRPQTADDVLHINPNAKLDTGLKSNPKSAPENRNRNLRRTQLNF